MPYLADKNRYRTMQYNRTGQSGLLLPAVSLGLWKNFGGERPLEDSRAMLLHAFDKGITHFDLANNYGPPYGSAEETFGEIFKRDLYPYRDEMVLSTKAGYDMWEGPYGNFGSKKYLISSLDQSLKRMGVDYVDIFYHHRPDPDTPLWETMDALCQIVRSGKALYIGISNYGPEETRQAASLVRSMGGRLLIHQMRYSMLDRTPECGLLNVLQEEAMGAIAFSPLARGRLSGKYKTDASLGEAERHKLQSLGSIAGLRGQTLAQMALSWLLRDRKVTSVIIGASAVDQIDENIASIRNTAFSKEEEQKIETVLAASN